MGHTHCTGCGGDAKKRRALIANASELLSKMNVGGCGETTKRNHRGIKWSPACGGCLMLTDADGNDCCSFAEGLFGNAEEAADSVAWYRKHEFFVAHSGPAIARFKAAHGL